MSKKVIGLTFAIAAVCLLYLWPKQETMRPVDSDNVIVDTNRSMTAAKTEAAVPVTPMPSKAIASNGDNVAATGNPVHESDTQASDPIHESSRRAPPFPATEETERDVVLNVEYFSPEEAIASLEAKKLTGVTQGFPKFQPLNLAQHRYLIEELYGSYRGKPLAPKESWNNSRFEFELEKFDDKGKDASRAVLSIYRDEVRISRIEAISGDENISLRFDSETQTLILETGDGSYLQMATNAQGSELIGNLYENDKVVTHIIFRKADN